MDQGQQQTGQTQTRLPGQFNKLLKGLGQDALSAYGQGAGAIAYPGSGVVPFSQQTLSGLNRTANLAQDNSFAKGILGDFKDLSSRNGLASGMSQPLGVLGNIANGGLGITTGSAYGALGQNAGNYNIAGQFGSLADTANNPYASEQNLQSYARGDMLGAGNPYLDAAIARTNRNTSDAVRAAASAAGRYGSGKFTGVLGQSLADAENTARFNQYQNDVNNQFQANSMLDTAANSRFANRSSALGQQQGALSQMFQDQLSALAGQTGVEGTNIANRAAAAQSQAGILDQGAQNLLRIGALAPSLNDMRFSGANKLLGVGALKEGKAGEYLQSDMDRYFATQNEPYTRIQQALGLISGAGPYATRTQYGPGTSPLQGALGGGIGGGVLGNMLFPGVGTAAGAGLGALAGLFA